MPPSPSEIFAWVGYAATQRLTTTPPQYVWGRLRNEEQGQLATIGRGRRWHQRSKSQRVTPEEQSAYRQILAILPPELRATLFLSVRYSVAELASLWGLQYRGAEKRIRVAREALKKLLNSEA